MDFVAAGVIYVSHILLSNELEPEFIVSHVQDMNNFQIKETWSCDI